MSQSVTLPTREHPIKEEHAPVATTPLLTQNLEDQQLVERAIRARGYWALHAVRVSVRTRVVFLGGRVCSYYLKQLAQETALAVPGAHQIRNDLDVVLLNSNHQEASAMRRKPQGTFWDPPDEQSSDTVVHQDSHNGARP